MLKNLFAMPSFEGRANRISFLLNTLGSIAIFVVAVVAASVALIAMPFAPWLSILVLPVAFVLIIIYFVSGAALVVRRLHDIGLTGWLIFCSFIPGANFIFFVAMLLLPGTNGHNAYGAPQGKTAGDYLRRGQWLERRRQYEAAFQNYAIVIESEQYSRQEQDAAIQCVERLRDRLLSEGIMKFDTV